MTAKDQLRQIQLIKYEIQALEDDLLEIDTKLTRITPVLSDMPGGHGNNDKMVDGISDLIEVKKALQGRINALCRVRRECEVIISRMENTTYRTILHERYFNGRSLEYIADTLHYSYYHACKLHGWALAEYDKMTSNDN